MLLLILLSLFLNSVSSDDQGKVLILGGQGLAGSATLSALQNASFHTSLLNDNNKYYNYHTLLEQSNTESIICSRPAGLEGCFELQNFLTSNSKVRAVVDFTSSTREMMGDAVKVLSVLLPDVYIFVSSAAVYDVSANPSAPVQETDGVRPEDEATRELTNSYNEFGDKMLGAEEELIASGLPYVILRCGDLVGPRDTTYRWWQYQVWAEHFDIIDIPFPIPNSLFSAQFSMTYGEDLARAVVSTLSLGKTNEVYNIAMDKTFTLPHFLLELCIYFGTNEQCWADFTDADETYNLYPSSHVGVISLEKAKTDLGFVPSSWEHVLKTTVEFYEGARAEFTTERDIVLKRLNENAVPYLKVETLNGAVVNMQKTVEVPQQLKSEL